MTLLNQLTVMLFTAFCIILFSAQPSTGQDVMEIVKKADELVRGKTSRTEFTMKIIKPDWTREFSMKAWSLGDDFALVYVTAPARDKGTVTLKRHQEVWNYLPSINKEIKIPSSMMMQSWMGSDFTNDDLVKQSSFVNDYTHRILKDSTINNTDCWVIESIPKESAAVVWGKITSCISKKGFFQLKVVFYDEDMIAVREMRSSDIRNGGNRIMPMTMEIIPLDKPGQKTVLSYQSAWFDEKLSDDFFSQKNMRRVR